MSGHPHPHPMFPGPLVRTRRVCLHFPHGPKDPLPRMGHTMQQCGPASLSPTFHISLLTTWVVQAPVRGALPTADAWLPGSRQSFHMCGNVLERWGDRAGLSKWVHWEFIEEQGGPPEASRLPGNKTGKQWLHPMAMVPSVAYPLAHLPRAAADQEKPWGWTCRGDEGLGCQE